MAPSGRRPPTPPAVLDTVEGGAGRRGGGWRICTPGGPSEGSAVISCAQLGTAVSCPYAAKQAGQGMTGRQAACLRVFPFNVDEPS